jgi:hypothetical protein
VKQPAAQQVTEFDNSGFALLKGRTWRYFMPKLYCILGRAPSNYKTARKMKVVWHCDVDLGHMRRVSRQHALIVYNFEKERFEVKCLSRKYGIRVNREEIRFEQGARGLKSGDIVQVAGESFFFMLPPSTNRV